MRIWSLFTTVFLAVHMVRASVHMKQMSKWEIPYEYLHSHHDSAGSYSVEPPITGIIIDLVNGTLNAFTEEKLMYFDLHEAADAKYNRYWLELPSIIPLTSSQLRKLEKKHKTVYGFPSIVIEGQASVQVNEWLYFWNSKNEEYDFSVRGSCLGYSDSRKSIFMYGGEVDSNNGLQVQYTFMEFKITTEEWTPIQSLSTNPSPISFAGCAFDKNEEKFFVFGGRDTAALPRSDFLSFDVSSNKWNSNVPQLGIKIEDKLYDLQCSLFSVDDNIYCVGGIYRNANGDEFVSNAIYMLDTSNVPAIALPSSGLKMEQPRAGARLIEINKCLWIVGGYQATSIYASSQPLTTIAGIGFGFNDCKLYPPKKGEIATHDKCEHCSNGTKGVHDEEENYDHINDDKSDDDDENIWIWFIISIIIMLSLLFITFLIIQFVSRNRNKRGDYQRRYQLHTQTHEKS